MGFRRIQTREHSRLSLPGLKDRNTMTNNDYCMTSAPLSHHPSMIVDHRQALPEGQGSGRKGVAQVVELHVIEPLPCANGHPGNVDGAHVPFGLSRAKSEIQTTTAKLNAVDPHAWLEATPRAIAHAHFTVGLAFPNPYMYEVADAHWGVKREMSKAAKRDTYKYHFKLGNKIVHTGITNDLDRREQEHRSRRGWAKGHIVQVGNRTTRSAALAWEDEQRRHGRPTGP